MQRWQIIVFLMALAFGLNAYTRYQAAPMRHSLSLAQTVSGVPANCPVTPAPDVPFLAPSPNAPSAPWPGMVWYGSAALWTVLPTDGTWSGLPHNPEGYTQKVVWWREGLWWLDEPQPALTVSGRRLDGDAPPLNVSRANSVFAEDMQSAMMVGVDFPTLGCWEITGRYQSDELSFVVRVAP